MKVNAKMKMIVAAVALAATGVSNAGFETPSSTNSSLMFTIWDDTPGLEASFNLNVMKRFNEFSTPGSTINIGNIFNDPVYTQFLGGHDKTKLKWNVAAGDTSGDKERVMTTGQVGSDLSAVDNSQAAGMATYLNQYMSSLINNGCSTSDTCGTSTKADPKYAGDNYGNNFNSFIPSLDNATSVGGELGFYSFASNIGAGEEPFTPATYARYENAFGLSKFMLSNTGDLSFSVAAVPVPAAVWLLGSALVGLVGVARRRNNAAA